jgi:hypothetical protein
MYILHIIIIIYCYFHYFISLVLHVGAQSISVCNKVILWGKTHSDWLSLTPQVDGPMPSPAQSCEIHRLGHNELISID